MTKELRGTCKVPVGTAYREIRCGRTTTFEEDSVQAGLLRGRSLAILPAAAPALSARQVKSLRRRATARGMAWGAALMALGFVIIVMAPHIQGRI